MQRILCTNASSVSMHSLKTLSIEMDLAESVFNRKIFINGRAAEIFDKISPSLILWEPWKLKVSAPLSLKKIHRMTLLSPKPVSKDSTFNWENVLYEISPNVIPWVWFISFLLSTICVKLSSALCLDIVIEFLYLFLPRGKAKYIQEHSIQTPCITRYNNLINLTFFLMET